MEDLDHLLDTLAQSQDNDAACQAAQITQRAASAAAHPASAAARSQAAVPPASAPVRAQGHQHAPAPVIDVLMLGDGLGADSGADEEEDGHVTAEWQQQQGGQAGADVDDADDEAVQADFGLSAADVVARIEEFVSSTVEALAQGQLPVLELVSRAAKNVRMVDADDGSGDVAGQQLPGSFRAGSSHKAEEEGEQGVFGSEQGATQLLTQRRAQQQRLQLGSKVQTKTLLHGAGVQAAGIARGGCACPESHMQVLAALAYLASTLQAAVLSPFLLPMSVCTCSALQKILQIALQVLQAL